MRLLTPTVMAQLWPQSQSLELTLQSKTCPTKPQNKMPVRSNKFFKTQKEKYLKHWTEATAQQVNQNVI